jgi:hypothetical protein
MKFIIDKRNGKWASINVPEKGDLGFMLNRPENEIFDTRLAANSAAHSRNAAERKAEIAAYLAPKPTPVDSVFRLEEWPEITSGLGIGGVGSDDYNIHTEQPANWPVAYSSRRNPDYPNGRKLDCGHIVYEAVEVTSASLGSSCPDCYDRMSD